MFKSIRNKIVLLFSVIAVVFLLSLFIQKSSGSELINIRIAEKKKQQTILLKKSIEILGQNLKSAVNDYSYWDEMVDFIKTGDYYWAVDNLDYILPTFNVSVVWVYTPSLSLVYSTSNDEDKLREVPVDKVLLTQALSKERFKHFFALTEKGLMEFRVAPVQSESDYRDGPVYGYLIAGRLWTNEYISELSILTGSKISLSRPDEIIKDETEDRKADFVIRVSQFVNGIDNKPVLKVDSFFRSAAIATLYDAYNNLFVFTIVFSVLILIVLFIFLFIFVSRPLSLLTRSLREENPAILKNLEFKESEFGQLSNLINNFLVQKKNLAKEIEERKKAENAQKESEQIYKTIFDSSFDAFLILNNEFRVHYSNNRFRQLFDFSENELKNENVLNLINVENEKQLTDIINRDALTEIKGPLELKLKSKKGGYVDVSLLSTPVRFNNEPHILIRFTDISEIIAFEIERQKHQAQLERTDRLASLGMLVAGVAHEINNPNAFISMNIPYIKKHFELILEILEDYNKKNPEFKIGNMKFEQFKEDMNDLLNDMKSGAERISEIIRDLKNFARVDVEYKNEPVKVKEAIEQSVRLLSSVIQEKRIDLSIDVRNDFIITGDRKKLEQVMVNVISNAIDAVPHSSGKIKIILTKDKNGSLCCIISDNGCGIAQSNINAVFDPFFTTKSASGGTGLGLSIARSIMDGMGYSIEIESQLNKGTDLKLIFNKNQG
ncbi:MAG: hypothetical protein Kow0098_15060 [Ignavibacteriaceae bacterium]